MQQVVAHDAIATFTINESDLDLCSTTSGALLGAMESLELIARGFRIAADRCISGIRINRELARHRAEMSTSLATMVSALFGYPTGVKIAKAAWREGISCREAALRENLLPQEAADELFDVRRLCDAGETEAMFRKYGKLRRIG